MATPEYLMDRLTSALSAAKEMGSVWVWATGLGPLRNAFPDLFGRELILVFSDGAAKEGCFCFEKNGALYALIHGSKSAEAERRIFSGSIVQLWSDDGWFSAEARMLPGEEAEAVLAGIHERELYGAIGARAMAGRAISRVIQLRRIAACTGKKGPGQYAWIWALFSFYLLIRSLFRPKK